METVLEVFHIIDTKFKVRKKTALFCSTANQAGTGHKLHFQPKNPARDKLTAINNKNGCGRAEVCRRQFWKYFMSLILSYKISKNTDLLHCTSNQVGTSHKLNFSAQTSSLGQIGSNQQQKWLWHGWGVMQTVRKCFISLIITYKVSKTTYLLRCTANQVGTGRKLHFHPKHPARAKLAAINNKNVCGTAEV